LGHSQKSPPKDSEGPLWPQNQTSSPCPAASGAVLDHLAAAVPELLGGSADLTTSNNTKAKGMIEIKPGEYGGSYMHYGVREHGMAAAMNGIALHGGLIPYGGTFLCFSDYCRPSIRLAAMMQIRTIFVMTHDSIGLGEDGPTHQPVEQLAALRAIPHLAVYRPGDPVETAECWEAILNTPRQAALLALSRQPMPLLRREPGNENKSAKGGYVLLEAEGGERKLTILSTGSECISRSRRGRVFRSKASRRRWSRCPAACSSSSRTPPIRKQCSARPAPASRSRRRSN
jgi:transketolase